ncbi:MAG: hypothetical protein IH595_07485 [Bacteroidales bacterium]|nr:hypothetical protein [Bacteroidales bacterium]
MSICLVSVYSGRHYTPSPGVISISGNEFRNFFRKLFSVGFQNAPDSLRNTPDTSRNTPDTSRKGLYTSRNTLSTSQNRLATLQNTPDTSHNLPGQSVFDIVPSSKLRSWLQSQFVIRHSAL